MAVTLAAPLSPLTEIKAAGEPVNLALASNGAAATANDEETTAYSASKAIDGNADREADKAEQSRWATKTSSTQEPKILTVDLGQEKTFQSFVIAWERTNITSYKIQTSVTGSEDEDAWNTVYEKAGGNPISEVNENIHLAEPATAQYVRLYVDGYNLNPGNWQSVSVYEFQVYEDEIPEDLLPEENYCLEGSAEASDYEKTPGDTQAAGKAIDGDQTTRWATNMSSSQEARTLTVTLPSSQRIQYFRIIWERLNIDSYKIEAAESDEAAFQTVYQSAGPVETVNEIISLDAPVWAKKIRLTVDRYNGGDNSWPNVSVAEFEAYAVEPDRISADGTPKEIADALGAPSVNQDGTALVFPSVSEEVTVEFLADYEQVVGKDGTIYKPLTEKTIKGIYKVTKDGESAEGSTEHTLTIPGQYSDAGTNKKPTVVPELAEWYGGTSEGCFTITDTASVYAPTAFSDAAEALVEDYNGEFGASLSVSDNADGADIIFESCPDNGLGQEGYIMETGNDKVTVKAEDNAGAYWATRSILQIAELNNKTMPTGITRDYPKYEVRGFMLDVARKPVSMETLEDVAKEMAYYKMNEFHLHLNDNLIFYEDYGSAEEALDKAYTGFRLESDVTEGGENQSDLTTEDMYYTKDEFRNFILDCRDMGVNITPEFDTPGHAGAFIRVRPDLMLQDIKSGNASRAGEQFDLSEEKYEESLAFVESIWDEYLNENMFDESMTVHIGTDEYYGESNRFRMFSDDLIEYIQNKGYTVRLWGSLSQMPGSADVRSEGVQMNVWNTSWSNPKNMYNEGFELINTIDGSLYIVPAAGYYYDYLNTQSLYNNWVPNNFGGTVIPAGSEQMLGSTYAIWNDSVDTRANGISEVDIYDRFADAVSTLASKNWGDPKLTYEDMKAAVAELGDAANSNPYHEAAADENGKYMSYEFDDLSDSSDNGRDLTVENAEIKDGSLTLKGGASYAETPLDKLATGNTLEFDIKLNTSPQAGDILFEADNTGKNGDYVHDIRIMDDGRLGFRRELYDYYFDYTIPVGKKVHLVISTNGTKTTLIADGESYPAVGTYINRQTDNLVRKENINIATLLLPLQRIGSKTQAIMAEIDNVQVLSGGYVDKTIIDSSEFTVKCDNENPLVGSEGPIELAFDGDTSTFWHSNYSPYQALPATVEIDMNQIYEINKFSYLPRQSGTNGIITKFSLYYKAEENGEWISLAEEQTWTGDSSQKTVKFDPVDARYLKFVALDGMSETADKFASAAEFTIHQIQGDETTYIVTVDGNEYTVKKGESLQITDPEKPGHRFDGYYLAGTDTKVDLKQPITDNMTVESRFTPYTVTVDAIEGVEFTVSPMNDKGEVTVTAPERENYNFSGWKVNGSETVSVYDNPYTFVPAVNTTLAAVYTEKKPEVTYHTVTINGQKVQVEDGKTIARPAADPVKEGYKFLGWYVGDKEYDFTVPVTSDLMIEARWEKITVTDPDGQKPDDEVQKPDETDSNKNDGEKPDKTDSKDKAAQTGDTANPAAWMICLAFSAGAGTVILKRRVFKDK